MLYICQKYIFLITIMAWLVFLKLKYQSHDGNEEYILLADVLTCDVLPIDTFEQTFVVLKGMLQSPHLKCHVNNIGIDKSLSNSDIFEHRCLQNTNKLYKYSGKCDNQHELKNILDTAMV